jgi:hypothetical protein
LGGSAPRAYPPLFPCSTVDVSVHDCGRVEWVVCVLVGGVCVCWLLACTCAVPECGFFCM